MGKGQFDTKEREIMPQATRGVVAVVAIHVLTTTEPSRRVFTISLMKEITEKDI